MPSALRIERNGWSDGNLGSSEAAPPPPSVASLVAGVAKACVTADSPDKAAAAVLAPLTQDPRLKAAWIGVTRGTTTVVHAKTGPTKEGAPVAAVAASVLEHGANGEALTLPTDAVAKLPGVAPGAVGFAVPFAGGEAWRGWLVAAGHWSADETKDVEHLVSAASGLAWLSLARLAAIDRARVAEERVAQEAIASLPPERAPDADPEAPTATPPAVPLARTGNAPVAPAPRPVASAPAATAKPAPAKPGTPGPGAASSHRTLLSAAALDGIRAFVEVTPGAKSPKLADGPTVHTTVHSRDASRWIARLLVAVAEGRHTVRVAVEGEAAPCVRIESDGPLAKRAGTSIASVSDEMATRGGSVRVEDAGQQARIFATFPKAA